MENSVIQDIALSSIYANSNNPRKTFDPGHIKDLGDSMKSSGLLQPITLRPSGKNYEIVVGERRYRAAKLLKWKSIAAIVKNITDEEMLEIQIIENLQREDINPLDEAAAFSTLLKKENIEWLASKIHKSKKYIADRLKLNDLVKEASEFVARDILPLGHAFMISKLSFADQQKCLTKCMHKDFGLTPYCAIPLQELKEFIGDEVLLDFEKVSFDPEDPLLYPQAGACRVCPKRTSNNNLLFDDITKDDRCTDAACFHQKTANHIEREKQKAREENAGKVYNGSLSKGYVGSNEVNVGGFIMPVQTAKNKNSIPVVITDAPSFQREKLGQTVYVDKHKLENYKTEVKEIRESGGNQKSNYEAARKKEFVERTWPRLEKIAALDTDNISPELLIEHFRKQFDRLDDSSVMALAGILGFNGFAKNAEDAWKNREGYDFEFKKAMYNNIIIRFRSPEVIAAVLFLLYAISDEGNDLDIDEEQYGYTWNRLMIECGYEKEGIITGKRSLVK
jgi:ParB/RepB/Spo0J family partition protein